MAVVMRVHWRPIDVDKFIQYHREFHDQHLKNAGAVDMKLYQHDTDHNLYIAEAVFESWAGRDAWERYFKTNTSAQEFGKKFDANVQSESNREMLTRIDY